MFNKLIARKTAISDLINLKKGEIATLEKRIMTREVAEARRDMLRDLDKLNSFKDIYE